MDIKPIGAKLSGESSMRLKLWLGTFAVAVLLLASASKNHAQDKKAQDIAALNGALKDVINAGAKMFNEQGDHAGCFRLYQGSLMSVKPFLPPEMQKSIDAGFASADKLSTFAERAFELRRVLDDIRSKTKPAGAEGIEMKSDKGTVAGKVTYLGKPVAGGYFVTLVAADGKKFSSAIQKDGTFQFNTPIAPGDFRVAIEPIPGQAVNLQLPPRYTAEGTSGLMIRVQAGKQQVDLNLVN
jgi:hypothetical protein